MRNLYAGQEAAVRIGHGTKHWLKIEKGVHQGCHPAYLTYMQSISYKMLGWMQHKLGSRLPGEILITLDMQMTTLMAESKEKPKSFLMKVKEEN